MSCVCKAGSANSALTVEQIPAQVRTSSSVSRSLAYPKSGTEEMDSGNRAQRNKLVRHESRTVPALDSASRIYLDFLKELVKA